MTDALHATLHQTFGFASFRPGQQEIVEAILERKHVLAIMPTGAGKSLCYQLPAIYSGQKTIVISPLVALMDDQVASLTQLGVEVSKIHSGVSRDQNVEQWKRFAAGTSNILYMSPERLMQPRMIQALQNLDVGLFVVDEAHCVSKWGADFRPDYEALANLKQHFPEAVVAAFTATADKATSADIAEKLSGNKCQVFTRGFDRPNLSLKVLPKHDFKPQLLGFIAERKEQSGIVYCLSRNETDDITTLLKDEGINAIAYHAGKDAEYRREAQDRFMTEEAVVMVATIAFGMGIDKPDIRYVIHASLPSSVEAFYQEIGRAGRDGAPAETLMFYGLQDIVKRQRMIADGQGSDQHKMLEQRRLEALVGYSETTGCRRLALLAYFDETIEACGNCDNCISPPAVEDYTELAQKVMAAIKQTGQFFGAAHIIDVLRGANTDKIRTRSHDQLDAFGKASDQSKKILQSLIRQMISAGALKVNLEKFGALEIAAKGLQIFEGHTTFMAKALVEPPTSKPKSAAPVAQSSNPELLAALKALRLELAKEQGVPAYVIFSDKALMQMAELVPKTEEQFLYINGIGQAKLEKFYQPFSKLLANYS